MGVIRVRTFHENPCYFITPKQGGMVSQDKIFVTDISAMAAEVEIKVYNENQLTQVYVEGRQRFQLHYCSGDEQRT